jgi:hypothetical protein
MRIRTTLFIIVSLIPDIFNPGLAFDQEGLIRLKKAGISESIIETVLNEKIFETCALTADDIIYLKKTGFSDTLISAYIWRQSFLGREKKVYTNNRGSSKISRVTLEDLERLKEDGFSDDILKAIIASQSEGIENSEQSQILEMFEHMELSVQTKKTGNERSR